MMGKLHPPIKGSRFKFALEDVGKFLPKKNSMFVEDKKEDVEVDEDKEIEKAQRENNGESTDVAAQVQTATVKSGRIKFEGIVVPPDAPKDLICEECEKQYAVYYCSHCVEVFCFQCADLAHPRVSASELMHDHEKQGFIRAVQYGDKSKIKREVKFYLPNNEFNVDDYAKVQDVSQPDSLKFHTVVNEFNIPQKSSDIVQMLNLQSRAQRQKLMEDKKQQILSIVQPKPVVLQNKLLMLDSDSTTTGDDATSVSSVSTPPAIRIAKASGISFDEINLKGRFKFKVKDMVLFTDPITSQRGYGCVISEWDQRHGVVAPAMIRGDESRVYYIIQSLGLLVNVNDINTLLPPGHKTNAVAEEGDNAQQQQLDSTANSSMTSAASVATATSGSTGDMNTKKEERLVSSLEFSAEKSNFHEIRALNKKLQEIQNILALGPKYHLRNLNTVKHKKKFEDVKKLSDSPKKKTKDRRGSMDSQSSAISALSKQSKQSAQSQITDISREQRRKLRQQQKAEQNYVESLNNKTLLRMVQKDATRPIQPIMEELDNDNNSQNSQSAASRKSKSGKTKKSALPLDEMVMMSFHDVGTNSLFTMNEQYRRKQEMLAKTRDESELLPKHTDNKNFAALQNSKGVEWKRQIDGKLYDKVDVNLYANINTDEESLLSHDNPHNRPYPATMRSYQDVFQQERQFREKEREAALKRRKDAIAAAEGKSVDENGTISPLQSDEEDDDDEGSGTDIEDDDDEDNENRDEEQNEIQAPESPQNHHSVHVIAEDALESLIDYMEKIKEKKNIVLKGFFEFQDFFYYRTQVKIAFRYWKTHLEELRMKQYHYYALRIQTRARVWLCRNKIQECQEYWAYYYEQKRMQLFKKFRFKNSPDAYHPNPAWTYDLQKYFPTLADLNRYAYYLRVNMMKVMRQLTKKRLLLLKKTIVVWKAAIYEFLESSLQNHHIQKELLAYDEILYESMYAEYLPPIDPAVMNGIDTAVDVGEGITTSYGVTISSKSWKLNGGQTGKKKVTIPVKRLKIGSAEHIQHLKSQIEAQYISSLPYLYQDATINSLSSKWPANQPTDSDPLPPGGDTTTVPVKDRVGWYQDFSYQNIGMLPLRMKSLYAYYHERETKRLKALQEAEDRKVLVENVMNAHLHKDEINRVNDKKKSQDKRANNTSPGKRVDSPGKQGRRARARSSSIPDQQIAPEGLNGVVPGAALEQDSLLLQEVSFVSNVDPIHSDSHTNTVERSSSENIASDPSEQFYTIEPEELPQVAPPPEELESLPLLLQQADGLIFPTYHPNEEGKGLLPKLPLFSMPKTFRDRLHYTIQSTAKTEEYIVNKHHLQGPTAESYWLIPNVLLIGNIPFGPAIKSKFESFAIHPHIAPIMNAVIANTIAQFQEEEENEDEENDGELLKEAEEVTRITSEVPTSSPSKIWKMEKKINKFSTKIEDLSAISCLLLNGVNIFLSVLSEEDEKKVQKSYGVEESVETLLQSALQETKNVTAKIIQEQKAFIVKQEYLLSKIPKFGKTDPRYAKAYRDSLRHQGRIDLHQHTIQVISKQIESLPEKVYWYRLPIAQCPIPWNEHHVLPTIWMLEQLIFHTLPGATVGKMEQQKSVKVMPRNRIYIYSGSLNHPKEDGFSKDGLAGMISCMVMGRLYCLTPPQALFQWQQSHDCMPLLQQNRHPLTAEKKTKAKGNMTTTAATSTGKVIANPAIKPPIVRGMKSSDDENDRKDTQNVAVKLSHSQSVPANMSVTSNMNTGNSTASIASSSSQAATAVTTRTSAATISNNTSSSVLMALGASNPEVKKYINVPPLLWQKLLIQKIIEQTHLSIDYPTIRAQIHPDLFHTLTRDSYDRSLVNQAGLPDSEMHPIHAAKKKDLEAEKERGRREQLEAIEAAKFAQSLTTSISSKNSVMENNVEISTGSMEGSSVVTGGISAEEIHKAFAANAAAGQSEHSDEWMAQKQSEMLGLSYEFLEAERQERILASAAALLKASITFDSDDSDEEEEEEGEEEDEDEVGEDGSIGSHGSKASRRSKASSKRTRSFNSLSRRSVSSKSSVSNGSGQSSSKQQSSKEKRSKQRGGGGGSIATSTSSTSIASAMSSSSNNSSGATNKTAASMKSVTIAPISTTSSVAGASFPVMVTSTAGSVQSCNSSGSGSNATHSTAS